MVELITVMVLLGILSAVIIPRMLNDAGMAAPAYRADVVAALRYAQKTAVSHRRTVWATVGDTSVTLLIAASNPAPVVGGACVGVTLPAPDGSNYSSSNASLQTAVNPPGNLFFQPNGEISSDCAGTAPVTASITVAGQTAITVEGRTGHVE